MNTETMNQVIATLNSDQKTLLLQMIAQYALTGNQPTMPTDMNGLAVYGVACAIITALSNRQQTPATYAAPIYSTPAAPVVPVTPAVQAVTQAVTQTAAPAVQAQYKKGHIPTREEVRRYWDGKRGDPDRYYDYMTAQGWTVKGKPIQYWTKHADNWVIHEKGNKTYTYTPATTATPEQTQPTPTPAQQPAMTDAEIDQAMDALGIADDYDNAEYDESGESGEVAYDLADIFGEAAAGAPAQSTPAKPKPKHSINPDDLPY